MKKKFVAQEEVVESIVSNIYINQRLVDSGDRVLISTSKSAILLDGPTGTGKTAILKEVAKQAYESGFGARELQAIFLDIRNNLSMNLIDNNLTNLHLSKEMFDNVKQKSLRRY